MSYIDAPIFWICSTKYNEPELIPNAPCSFGLYSRKIIAIVKMDFSPKNSNSFLECRSGLGFSSASSLNTLDCMPASLPSMTEQTIWLVDARMELEPFFFFLSCQPFESKKIAFSCIFISFIFLKMPSQALFSSNLPSYEVWIEFSDCCWCSCPNDWKQLNQNQKIHQYS